jgi:hypothetical protein
MKKIKIGNQMLWNSYLRILIKLVVEKKIALCTKIAYYVIRSKNYFLCAEAGSFADKRSEEDF